MELGSLSSFREKLKSFRRECWGQIHHAKLLLEAVSSQGLY